MFGAEWGSRVTVVAWQRHKTYTLPETRHQCESLPTLTLPRRHMSASAAAVTAETRFLAYQWHRQSTAGYCRSRLLQAANGSCTSGDFGSLPVPVHEWRLSSKPVGGWLQHAARLCLARCAACERCKFISHRFAQKLHECHWFHKCELTPPRQHRGTRGFRSGDAQIDRRMLHRKLCNESHDPAAVGDTTAPSLCDASSSWWATGGARSSFEAALGPPFFKRPFQPDFVRLHKTSRFRTDEPASGSPPPAGPTPECSKGFRSDSPDWWRRRRLHPHPTTLVWPARFALAPPTHLLQPERRRPPVPSCVTSDHGVPNRTYSIGLVTYAEGRIYRRSQRALEANAVAKGSVDRVFSWDAARLNATPWARAHLHKARRRYGRAARWVWKPHLILEALEHMREGDFVAYVDSSRHYVNEFVRGKHSVTTHLSGLTNFLCDDARRRDLGLRTFGMVPGMRLPLRNRSPLFYNGSNTHTDHHNLMRRCDLCDVVWHLGLCAPLDEACCDVYLHSPHVQAAYSVWQKRPMTLHFLRVWRAALEDPLVLERSKWGDQSVLSLLVTWYSIHVGLRIPYVRVDPRTVEVPRWACGAAGFEERPGDARTRCTAEKAEAQRISYANRALKRPDALFGRFEGRVRGRRPLFLAQQEGYPECREAAGAASGDAAGIDC